MNDDKKAIGQLFNQVDEISKLPLDDKNIEYESKRAISMSKIICHISQVNNIVDTAEKSSNELFIGNKQLPQFLEK